jgi:dihydroxy-acid dehydratase
MHIVVEAIGMALPGTAPVKANSDKMFSDARAAGARIVEMVLEDLTPRKIMTPDAFHNAVAAVLAVSGSINCIKHLQAVATESGLDLDVFEMFERIAATVPMLTAVRPNGDHSIEQLEAAGGARGVLKRIEHLLKPAARTATGGTMGEQLAGIVPGDDDVIRTLDRPYSDEPAIVIVHGSLAPESGIIKLGQRDPGRPLVFEGPAVVHDTTVGAIAAINSGALKAGDVLVVRGMGLVGGPAMGGSVSTVVFTLYARGLTNLVAVVSDGQLSGLVNKGLVIGEVSPEAAIGGPLGLVKDGDRIAIDVNAGTVDLLVSAAEVSLRRDQREEIPLNPATGYLGQYRRQVRPMRTGGVMEGQYDG